MTLEPENLFIVADGMGGQQAGEKASLMAVELIPRAIARRLTPKRRNRDRSRSRFARPSPRSTRRSWAARAWSPNTRTWARPSSWPSSATTASTSRGSVIPGHTACATARSSSLPRTIRWPMPCSTRARSQGRAVDTQVQERALSLPGKQGRAERARGLPRARRSTRRSVSAGQRWTHRSRPRRGAGPGAVHRERPPAGGRDAQGHWPWTTTPRTTSPA